MEFIHDEKILIYVIFEFKIPIITLDRMLSLVKNKFILLKLLPFSIIMYIFFICGCAEEFEDFQFL